MSFKSIHNYLKGLEGAIYFHTWPCSINVSGGDFSLPPDSNPSSPDPWLYCRGCFSGQPASRMHPCIQHITGLLCWVWHSSTCFTCPLMSRWWPWSQQKRFSFCNHTDTSWAPAAGLDGRSINTSQGPLPKSLISSNCLIIGCHNYMLSLYIYLWFLYVSHCTVKFYKNGNYCLSIVFIHYLHLCFNYHYISNV